MAVFRVHKTSNYTVMSNYHLRDGDLSLKAKGMLSVILSLPDDWNYSIAGLAAICKEGTTAVKSALGELSNAGYVVVTKLYPGQTESGRIEYVYDIHEQPKVKQGVENLPLECQGVEDAAQLSINEPSTKNKGKAKVEKREYPESLPCPCGGSMLRTASRQTGTGRVYYRCDSCGGETLWDGR